MAQACHLTFESYLLNSIWTHKSCRYAMENVLGGFATDARLSQLANPNVIMFSERNSPALNAADNTAWGSANQDDYDTWPGEAALVKSGAATYPNDGWIKWDQHLGGSNYLYADGHVKWMRWSAARKDQYPDHVVRQPLIDYPQ